MGFWEKLKSGLSKTKEAIFKQVNDIFKNFVKVDEEMLEELDMPVGILNAALGGSSIASWISREKADSEPELKSMMKQYVAYKESSEWNAQNQNVYADIGACHHVYHGPSFLL